MPEIERRLERLGLQLPPPWTPRGMFAPWQKAGDLVFLSGQICEWNGEVVLEGPVGAAATVAQARDAVRICVLNLLHCLKLACDNLDNTAEFVRLGGFVNCVAGFPDSPKVIDGDSELLIEIFDEAGRHVRTAVGVAGLPGNAAVEVDAIVRLNR